MSDELSDAPLEEFTIPNSFLDKLFEFTGDAAPTATTTASKGDMFTFRYNGSKWLEVGRNLNLTLS